MMSFKPFLNELTCMLRVSFGKMIWLTIATEQATALPDAIEHILMSVHAIFAKRGFTLNLQTGKTGGVATFRGSGAPMMRAKYQLTPRPGMDVQMGERIEFVHFPACYKHLGTIFRAAHTMDQEIATRIGMAKGTFAQIAAPILCNRRIPEPTRIRLFRALIESRLFYGMGAWQTPAARQMMKFHSALLSMLRKLVRLRPEQIASTSATLFHRAQVCSPQARVGMERLLFAQSVWQRGLKCSKHCLHREDALPHYLLCKG